MNKVNKNGIGYYTIDRMEDVQNQLLRLLELIDKICRENDLKYFLDGGTAIGAYRHGGFIPWDDDLDISMLKPDYLKLVDILKSMDRSKYFLFDYEQNMHSCCFFGERCPFFAAVDEKKRHIYPIKIDIAPLNVIENTEESLTENRILRELSGLVLYGKCSDQFYQKALELYELRFDKDSKKFLSFYNLEYGKYHDVKNATLAYTSTYYATERTYKYSDIFPLKEITFSGIKSFVPTSDVIIAEIYGDYMKMPDLEARKPVARNVFYARYIKFLYEYLIDKTEKTKLQKLFFSLTANLLCK